MKEAMKDFIIPSWKIFQLQIQEIILYWNSLTTLWIHHVTIQECIERGLTHSVPLKARLKYIVQIQSTKILKLLFKMYILVQSLT
jgi:DNA-directed RNA polymerase beta subunit